MGSSVALARKAWERLIADEARYRQLRVMSRFGLTVGQARELFDRPEPAEVLDNPYCLYEIGGSRSSGVLDDRSRPVAAGRRRAGGARQRPDRRAGDASRRRSAGACGLHARAGARRGARAHAPR